MSIKNFVERSQRALYALYDKVRNLHILIDLQFLLFECMIVPVLLYASKIKGYELLNLVEKLYINFMKISLNVSTATPNAIVYGETGYFLCK